MEKKQAVPFEILVVLLLASILVVQVMILRKLPPPPPTLADLRETPAEGRKDVLLKRPLVYVGGSVAVENTVNVEVGNTPLEVEVSR